MIWACYKDDEFICLGTLKEIALYLGVSYDTVKTYKSIPYREDKLDIDLPNFSLTKLKKTHWKASQGCSYLLFTLLYGISVAFIYSEKTRAYFTLILISHIFLFLANYFVNKFCKLYILNKKYEYKWGK